ncbi:FAD-binding domain-containing protein [Amylostereum chailletii]|nr:FAD-binding domain-containing protein [Amylostereum chailletii]
MLFAAVLPVTLLALSQFTVAASRCRRRPGDADWPTNDEWDALNGEVDNRLVAVLPSGKVCEHLNCTDAQWGSGVFRNDIPGQMLEYNWEQDYTANPPSICLRTSETCGQGNVPLYAINATTPAHIQAGVNFASKHNLRVVIKASGHDYLGRSTARDALLLWTRYFETIEFTESFVVNGTDVGPAVTVGSGLGLKAIYAAAAARGKAFVGGTAATVVPGGGYSQGAGHSALSPLYGLSADNVFQYQIVLANGSLVTADDVSNPDLFWALRGGGAGSWGVIVSITLRVYPDLSATLHQANIALNSSTQAGAVMAAHARHIFDYDDARAAQYAYLYNSPADGTSLLQLSTLFPNRTAEDATAMVQPFLDDAVEQGAIVVNATTVTASPNVIVAFPDDQGGYNSILGSRLLPPAVYSDNATAVGEAYTTLLDQGADSILCHLVAGGKVAENANIDSAVTPKWRTAKTHVIVTYHWDDSATLDEVEAFKQKLTTQSVPVLSALSGEADPGSYSNEADVREPNWKTTFYGTNYARLEAVKAAYDPEDLFIVATGVGSDRWDAQGMCRV